MVISRPRCQETLLCESCISLQTTHTLTFALHSAREDIPEAHFQFMQNHCGKTDSFHFNWFSAVYSSTSLFNVFFEFAVFVLVPVCLCVCVVTV